MSELRIERVPPARVLSLADEIPSVWIGITSERLNEILPRHVRRDGFRFLAARAADGTLAGIVYGYLGGPGQWWHDLVSAAMTPAQRARWLAAGHFEFVELHVAPAFRRRGLGSRLHDEVLAGLDSPTAVLSTQCDNNAAIRLYERRGWQLVLEPIVFGPEYPPYRIMAKDLRTGLRK
jgi:ribosomal protein S18 acetylase RimI-like enzyme